MSIRFFARLAIVGVLASASGCASWDHMSSRQKSMVVGAGAGGLIGAAFTGGGVLSTIGGAAIGGVVGDQVGKAR